MRLIHHADYALQLLMYAALKDNRLVPLREMANGFGIFKNHLIKVALQRGKLERVQTVRGRNGGLRLARAQ